MKTLTLTSKALLAMAVMFAVGCAKEKGVEPSASSLLPCGSSYCETPVTPTTPVGTGTNPSETGYSSGATANLNLSNTALQRLFYNSRPVNPTNVRITLSLTNNYTSVIISYIENNKLIQAAFGTRHPKNPGISNASYNGWVSQNGQMVWKGFFQDEFGAIVLVIDKALSQGDGQAASIVGGSIYFQNFNQSPLDSPIQGTQAMCWQITMGPYDCRSFLVNGNDKYARIDMTSSSTPSTRGQHKTVSYELLGDFAGISRAAAGF